MVNLYIFSAIAIVIGAGGIVTVSLLYALTGNVVPLDNGVVVDAGSSHTQIILYKWKANKLRGTGDVVQMNTCTVPGGLASNTNATVAASSLLNCLSTVSSAVPPGEISTTSIFLGATGGFRLLNETNHGLSHDILQKVNETFGEYGFRPEQVAILTGQEEGLYAWITSNFLSNNLKSLPSIKTTGAMDMGGASTQIAFSVPEKRNGTINLRLYGNDHYVIAESSLCYGVLEFYRRHLAELVLGAAVMNDTIDEPCAPVDYYFNKTCQDLFIDQPCTKILNANRDFCLSEKDNRTFSFHGTGNVSSCWDRVSSLLNNTNCQQKYGNKHCFQPVVVPTFQKFHAFSSFFFTVDFLNATGKSLAVFQNASREFCAMTEDQVENIPTTATNETLHQFCFQAVFIEQLLLNFYLFNDSTWGNIQFLRKFDKTDVGWALGYMIDTTNAIPAEDPSEPSISLIGMILVLVICLGLLAVGGFFIFKKKRLSSEISYVQV